MTIPPPLTGRTSKPCGPIWPETIFLFSFRTADGKHTWWSNPYNADEDPNANNSKKADLKSTLVINAVKVTGTDSPSRGVCDGCAALFRAVGGGDGL